MSESTQPRPVRGGFIFALSLTGVVMGLLTSLVGLPQAVEVSVWIAAYVVWGVVVVRTRQRPFLTTLLASLLSGVWTGTLQVVLAEQYIANNPWYAEDIVQAGGMTAAAVIGFALTMGLAWGLVVGGIVTLVARRRDRAQSS
ncbi:MAG: hypothetical protein K0V04_12580 [Deltaproteobacteria bacterium]|nr:hypothetical protein [Deltaproteobacteria bacterium]